MSGKECISKLSKVLFWDMDTESVDMDKYPRHIIQRVLEYGNLEDWMLIKDYYGFDKIVEECKQMRTLDPVCLSFICAKSNTKEEEFRCYHFRQSFNVRNDGYKNVLWKTGNALKGKKNK